MANFPKLKKKITSFLAKEEGKISKESLIKTGIMIGVVAGSVGLASQSVSAACSPQSSYPTHVNNLGVESEDMAAKGTHGHHGSHCNHSSHGSHCSSKGCL